MPVQGSQRVKQPRYGHTPVDNISGGSPIFDFQPSVFGVLGQCARLRSLAFRS